MKNDILQTSSSATMMPTTYTNYTTSGVRPYVMIINVEAALRRNKIATLWYRAMQAGMTE